jgi:hypothetical protein
LDTNLSQIHMRPSAVLKITVITDPITIEGVAGPVVVTTPTFLGQPAITVGGQPAPRVGRRQYTLPATVGGTVDATLRTGFADPYPSVEINGVRHRTGPKVPVGLRVLALLPILLVGIGGLIGGLVGALGVVVKLVIARAPISSAVKTLIMIGVGALACLVWVGKAVALQGAMS